MKQKLVFTSRLLKLAGLQIANPTETVGCESLHCGSCQSERVRGGNCRGCGINYQLECQLCPEGSKSLYDGESLRNMFTRVAEHLANYRNRSKFIHNEASEHCSPRQGGSVYCQSNCQDERFPVQASERGCSHQKMPSASPQLKN